MDGRRKKSRKRSDTSLLLQPDQAVFFLDRNLGRHKVADRLRAEDIKVEVHDDHFSEKALDEQWIKFVAEQGWIAVTKDERIQYRAAEIGAVQKYKARVIVVVARNAVAEEIAAVLRKGHRRIVGLAAKAPAPFIAKIYRNGRVKLVPSYLENC